jgi:hypothetical protein
MSKQEYIVELELDVPIDEEHIEQIMQVMECYDLTVAGIAEDVGPEEGAHLFFIRGTERDIINMYDDYAGLQEDEILELMEFAYAIN